MKVLKIKENKDGSAVYTFGITNEEKNLIKGFYNKKRFSNKLFKAFMLEAFYNFLTKESIKEGIKDLKEGRFTDVKDLDKFFEEL